MQPSEYAKLTALEMGTLVRRGLASPNELVEAALAQIEQLNPSLNAVVLVDAERAKKAAARVDRTALLAGAPVLIKDNNLFVDGWPTTFASRFYAGAAPRQDSELIKRLRRSGAVLIGKTNTPEFAADWTTEPTLWGATRNPWDTSRSPGGSSGGSAAAVASGMVPAAHGNDNAGSIRVPAAVCGLVGLKPTRGLVPIGPTFPELAAGLDCEFMLTRDVADAASFLDVLAGPELGGRYHVERSVASHLAVIEERQSSLKIAYALRRPDGSEIDSEIAAAIEAAVRRLERAGNEISAIALPHEPSLGHAAEAIGFAEMAFFLRLRAREIGREPNADEMEALTEHALTKTRRLDAIGLLEARHALHEAAGRIAHHFAAYDMIVTPTTGEPAPPIGWFDSRTRPFDMATWEERSGRFAPFTDLFNATGQPAISIPAGLTKAGLPIGIQIAARQGQDALVLQVAHGLLRELGGPIAPAGA